LLEASESAFFVPTFVHGVCDPLVIEETPSADALFWHSEMAAKTENLRGRPDKYRIASHSIN
jgi:hypothetical protein